MCKRASFFEIIPRALAGFISSFLVFFFVCLFVFFAIGIVILYPRNKANININKWRIYYPGTMIGYDGTSLPSTGGIRQGSLVLQGVELSTNQNDKIKVLDWMERRMCQNRQSVGLCPNVLRIVRYNFSKDRSGTWTSDPGLPYRRSTIRTFWAFKGIGRTVAQVGLSPSLCIQRRNP